MFCSGMKEATSNVVSLQGICPEGLKKIIDFIYSGEVMIGMDDVCVILDAATHMQISHVVAFCTEFLVEQLTMNNCLEIGNIASQFNLSEVDDFINRFLLQNFTSIPDLCKIPFERLKFLLGSNDLQGVKELDLFHYARVWLKGGLPQENRLSRAGELMEQIKFPLIQPSSDLNEIKDVDFMKESKCMQLLLEATIYQMLPNMQPLLQTSRTQIRSNSNHLIVLGGVLRQQLSVSNQLRAYDENKKDWLRLREMDHPRYQHGIAVIGNFLFVVGGQSNYDTKGKTAVDTVFRFDPRTNSWREVASLNEKRTFFHLSAIGSNLYAVGGRNSAGELATVEKYSPKEDEWNFVCKMKEPHYGHAGTVYDGKMYISGGITHDSFQKELLCYDPTVDDWETKNPMTVVRGLHCMTTHRDRLYVFGGNHFRGSSDYDDVLECEYYLPRTDQWVKVAPMLTGQSDVGIAVYNDRIYVTGGYSWNNRCMVDIVQCYDPAKDKWENRFELPEALGGIRACTLVLKHPSDYTVVNVEKEISMLEIGSNHGARYGLPPGMPNNASLDSAPPL
ncbi:Oidioi.mRNA.OKI2018_I69.chr2.g6166.t1.cds [Oikopleura dioica]|uniref:Oidioi.mRNA.OKI2018_I69.chr2.g6166.t1.cds n=1 Tax=Oikopleura dioica TaxID=34765 RepID=A0ABN7T8M2_OIKDI|nr:Oidioi.mRNA.OKI2018_I69.chr2.g6166.t1.cds [Oikopleura dioica]